MAQTFVNDSIAAIFADRTLDPVEGVWQWPDDGAIMLVRRHTATSFDIYLLDSPRADIRPGVKIGELISAPASGNYDCHLSPSALGSGKARSHDCHVAISEGNRLIFKPYRRHDSLSLLRLVPYVLRVGFLRSTRPDNLDGARRIYPPSTLITDITL